VPECVRSHVPESRRFACVVIKKGRAAGREKGQTRREWFKHDLEV